MYISHTHKGHLTHSTPWMQYANTALIMAAKNGHRETVNALLKGGADVDAQDGVKRGGVMG